MPRRQHVRRRPGPLPDEVAPASLTDPSRQAARDRRWAKKTAAGSMTVLALLGAVLAELFQPSRAKATAERLQDQAHADKAMQVGEPEDGGGRFSARVRLH